MHSVTDRQTDGQQDYANSRSCCVAERSAKKHYICRKQGNTAIPIAPSSDYKAYALADPNMGDLVQQANTPKLGQNRGGVKSTRNVQKSPKRCKMGPRLLYYGLIGSHIRAFEHEWPWMTLNGWNVPLAEIKSSYGSHQKNFNNDKLILSAAKCRPMIVVSKKIQGICGYVMYRLVTKAPK